MLNGHYRGRGFSVPSQRAPLFLLFPCLSVCRVPSDGDLTGTVTDTQSPISILADFLGSSVQFHQATLSENSTSTIADFPTGLKDFPSQQLVSKARNTLEAAPWNVLQVLQWAVCCLPASACGTSTYLSPVQQHGPSPSDLWICLESGCGAF